MFRDSNKQSQNFKVSCKLLCCQACTFCNKKCKAAAKERLKSSLRNQRNKFCELCFFCRSVCLCPKCDKCPQCCSCPPGRRAPSALLADLGPPRCKSESSVHFEGRLHSPIQNQTSSGEGPLDSQWLCKPHQEPLPGRGFAGPTAKGGSRDGKGSNISSLLQPTVHSSKTKSEMATNLGPQCSKQIFERKNIQNGNSENNSVVPAKRGMGDISGFQRRLFPHSSSWWTKESNVLPGQSLHPLSHAVQIFTDASKEGWGAHLGDFTARGVWSVPESHLHINFLELKAVLLALKRFQHLVQGKVVLVATDNTTVVAYINKEGGMRSGSLCALLWRLLCWCNLRQVVLKARHIPGRLNVIADKLSRQGQVIQTEWSLHQEVFNLLVQTWHQPQVDMFATKYNCKLAQYVSPVPDPSAWAVDALTVSWEKLDMYVFPPVSLLGKVVSKLSDHLYKRVILIAPGWPNMPWFWDLVELSSQIPLCLPSHPDLVTQPFNKARHRNLTNLNLHAIKEQGFSSPVASRIEAPQRSSTRTVYEAKWAIFVRWCESSQVDFRSPSVKQIADFLLHLFQEKNLQPSTIDGYRSAIADKLGNSSLNVSKDENLTRLLDSFHRDRPKGRRGIPSWNLSLVLHQLTKPPFEPLRKASLKHLTFKTVFLLALGSGKRRSEIHAWLNKNIRHQADWSKVSLYPSPMFLAKNHLAKEGPECVAPVVIPALAPTLDKSLKEDRSLCPVRALHYYLDKTQDVRQGKELVFVSFKKGFTKDISPATISSWIKQTVILCYDLSDQESLTLHQVKAHDVRAFAASKAFQGGISLDQILAACHWKSHNTFTQFYLKDVAWADSELFHLGPVVAAQQIHQ